MPYLLQRCDFLLEPPLDPGLVLDLLPKHLHRARLPLDSIVSVKDIGEAAARQQFADFEAPR
jgi:hypothetical protein